MAPLIEDHPQTACSKPLEAERRSRYPRHGRKVTKHVVLAENCTTVRTKAVETIPRLSEKDTFKPIGDILGTYLPRHVSLSTVISQRAFFHEREMTPL